MNDVMGRPASLTDNSGLTSGQGPGSPPINWVQNVQYDYAGRRTSMQYLDEVYYTGSGAYAQETMSYNANGQLTSLSRTATTGFGVSGGVQYAYSATQNNGQITQATDTISGETIGYQYDALKRLVSASSTPNAGSSVAAWTQTYQYDGFGNLTSKVLNGAGTPIPVSGATNRLTNSYYDANGNMTTGVGASFTYDEANRITSAAEVSGGTEYYGYAADNKRIYRMTASGAEEWTFYGAYGEKLGVYWLNGPTWQQNYNPPYGYSYYFTFEPLRTNVWFAGKQILDANYAMYPDRLGTNRWIVGDTSAGMARFYPYGDEITSTGNDRTKFATYNRDSFTGLDYADQRYYASAYGRFNSPDPYQAADNGGIDANTPQSWNRYAYVQGDPVNYLDPHGLFGCQPQFCDGDDGDDPSPGPTPAPTPAPAPPKPSQYDRSFTQKFGMILKKRINALGNCVKILGGASANSLTQVASTIQFFNGAPSAPGANRSQNAVVGNGNATSLFATVGSSLAVVLLDSAGNNLPDVVLGQDFINDPTVSQSNTLLHEALHVALGLDDPQLKAYLAQYGFVPQQFGTDDITQWLAANCPSIPKP